MSESILYGIPLSPFVRKVEILLNHYGVEYKCEAGVTPMNLPEGFVDISPLGKIPAYKDDKISLADSSVICQYIDKRYSNNNSLYPNDPSFFAKSLWFEEYADSKLVDACGKIFFERIVKPKLLNKLTDEDIVESKLTNDMPPVLKYLESQSPKNNFICGDFSIADIALGTQFLNVYYAGFEVKEEEYPKLSAYIKRILASTWFVKAKETDSSLLY